VGYMHRSLPHTVSIVKCGKTCCFKHNTHKTLVPTSHVVNVDDNFSQWSSGRHTNTQAPASYVHERLRQYWLSPNAMAYEPEA